MPATRSRTEHWRDCLAKLQERGGALEISVARSTVWFPSHGNEVSQPGADIVWRVKVIRISDEELIVEAPGAFGETVILRPGLDLIGAMTIGQNRWMFHTRTLPGSGSLPARAGVPGYLSLAMPTSVERCTRRHNYRISTANLNLPNVECWSLLDPTSVRAAEAANREQILALEEGNMKFDARASGRKSSSDDQPFLLPDVGPQFHGKLVNLSGGGIGVNIEPSESAAAQHRPLIWLRMDLRPAILAPLAVTVRAVHTHLSSNQSLYLGLAFDFEFNPEHRHFVIEQFASYLDKVQAAQAALPKAG